MKRLVLFPFLIMTLVGFSQPGILVRDLDKQGVITHLTFDNTKSFIPLAEAKKLLHDTLKLTTNDDLVLTNEVKDKLGLIRQDYEQHYNGIKVEDGRFGVCARDGKIEYISGEYKKVGDVLIIPSLSENEALKKALDYIKADKYRWKIQSEESRLKIDRKDSSATFYPKGELLICKDLLKTNSIYRLAYKFDIFACVPLSHKIYYIDAITGSIVDVRDLIFYDGSNVTANVATLYSGLSVPMTSYNDHPNHFIMYETRPPNNVIIHTYNANNLGWKSGLPVGYSEFNSVSPNWPADTATDVHWATEKVIDYWQSVRQRKSLDSLGMPINSYVHYQANWEDACWDGYEMCYGDGDTIFKPLVSLDVVAHETGHAIMQYTAMFNQSSGGETNSLNEGFSDIWGAVIEHYAAPSDSIKQTWLIGEEIMKNGALCLRSLRSPKTEGYNDKTKNIHGGYPDTYQGTYWIDPSGCSFPYRDNDWCYSHTNATVLSHWFYLLSKGGHSTNDKSNNYTVLGLGINVASDIVWEAEHADLHNHPTAQYSNVMTLTIQAANNLYTTDSLEVMQVKNAWYAVGLGSQPTQMSISGNSIICPYGTSFTVINVPLYCTVTWSCSNNIHLSNINANPVVATPNGSGSGWVNATITSPHSTNVTLNQYNVTVYANTTIIGSAIVCSSGSTFSLSSPCQYDNIVWNVGPYLSITSGQGTSSCTIAATGNGNSYVNVTLYKNGSSTTPPQKAVWAGTPIFNSISGPNPPYSYKGCTGQSYTFWANPARDPNSQSTYQWMVQPGYLNWHFQYQYYDWVTIVFNDPYDYYQVIARVTNTCGASNWVYKSVAIMNCYYFSMSPNPASEEVSITVTKGNTEATTMDTEVPEFNVQISDLSGNLYYAEKKSGLFFTLPVSNLKNGSYLVIISYDNQKQSISLIVQH